MSEIIYKKEQVQKDIRVEKAHNQLQRFINEIVNDLVQEHMTEYMLHGTLPTQSQIDNELKKRFRRFVCLK